MRGNKETVTPDDMTAKLDLVDPGGWKSLMPSLENVVTRKLCLAKLYGMDVVVMDAALALKMDVHDVTMPSQLMILIKAVTEVRRVKKCFDRAVDDNFFSLKSDDIMVDYDRASMTRMISTSVRIGSLSLVNDDVVEVDLKMDLFKSGKGPLINIKKIRESSLDEITRCKVEGVVKLLKFNSRKEVEKSPYQTDVNIQVICENEENRRLLMLLKSSRMIPHLMMRKIKQVQVYMMCSSSNDIEIDVLYKLNDAEENEDATADLAVTWSNGLNPLKKACRPPIKSVWLPQLSSLPCYKAGNVLILFNVPQFRDPRRDVMPMKIRAKVDVAEEMQGGTLKFPTGKKRLEDETGGIFLLSTLPRVAFMPSDPGDNVEKNLEKLMLCLELL